MVIKLCKVATVLIALSKIPIEQVRFQNLGVLKKKKKKAASVVTDSYVGHSSLRFSASYCLIIIRNLT